MNYEMLRIVMSRLTATLGFGWQSYHSVRRSRTHSSKLIVKGALIMSNNILKDKSKVFAKDIVFLCRKLKQNGVESALTNQLLRSGTSVGANIHEAQYAQGTKDFISKFEIALKECNESEYWLELLYETNSLSEEEFKKHQSSCIEIRRMLISSVTTLKKKQE